MDLKRFGGVVLVVLVIAAGQRLWAALSEETVYSPELAALSQRLRDSGRTNAMLASAELLVVSDGSIAKATTLIANDRTHVFPSTFVENDPRRGSPFNTITYLVDQSDGSVLSWNPTNTGAVTLSNAITEPEVDASMAAWTGLSCNGPLVGKVADSGADPDLVDGLIPGFGTVGSPFADVTHAGWYPTAFFNAIVPNGGSFILGITFTFVFLDNAGNPTDVDRDGRPDAAFREIYYNRAFGWGTGTGSARNIDIQSVSAHESGHGFGLAHFGKVFITNVGTIQFSPKALMNAVYVAPDRTIYGSDNSSFCQIWGNSH